MDNSNPPTVSSEQPSNNGSDNTKKSPETPETLLKKIFNFIFGNIMGVISDIFGWIKKATLGTIDFIRDAEANNPHIYLLVMTTLFIISFFIFQWSMKRISSSPTNFFSNKDYAKAVNLGDGSFSLKEKAIINTEKKALSNFFSFFKARPFNDREGILSVYQNMGNMMIPIIGFITVFVFPFITLGYNIWFIWNFWLILIKAVGGLFYTILRILLNLLIVCPLSKVHWDLEVTKITPFKAFVESIFGGSCTTTKNLLLKYLDNYIKKPFDKKQTEFMNDIKHKADYIYEKYIGQYIEPTENKYNDAKRNYVTNVIDGFLVKTLVFDHKYRNNVMSKLDSPSKGFVEKLVKLGGKYIYLPFTELMNKISKSTPDYDKYIETPRKEMFDWLTKEGNDHKYLKTLVSNVEKAEKKVIDFI